VQGGATGRSPECPNPYNGAVFRSSVAALVVALLGTGASSQPPPPPVPPPDRDAPIECEFRVFEGDEEVTVDSSVRIFPTGIRTESVQVEPSNGRLLVHVPPAIYDAQVVRFKQGHVANIKWSERLVIMRYPDENGRHLEVVNFRARFGALQVVSPSGLEFELNAYAPGAQSIPESERRPVGRLLKGAGYQLLIAPAGRYDVRIKGGAADAAERWLLEVEIPADRTRLKRADGG
jgi:hypothetical protein